MKAIVTVVGKDQVGIIAGVCNRLAEYNINAPVSFLKCIRACITLVLLNTINEPAGKWSGR